MRYLFLAALLPLLSCVTPQPVVVVASEPQQYAWWLRATFFPSGKAFRDVPVGQLNAGWCAIDELRPEIFPDIDEVQGAEAGVRDPQAKFSQRLILSGQPAEVVLTIYKACSGETGTALIAFERNSARLPVDITVLSVRPLRTPAHWATAHLSPGGDLEIWWCFACDDISTYRWNERSREFELLPALEDDDD